MIPAVTRRWILGSGAALAALGPFSHVGRGTAAPLPPRPALDSAPPPVEISLAARERPVRLLGDRGPATPLWTFADDPLPVVRVPRGARVRAELANGLTEHTSIHWHGLRIPNDMDGVPYVTQPPVEPGEKFHYDFVPPDTGTFFFHPHCNTIEQLGRGLAGLLIVEGDETQPYDADLVCVLKDWRLNLETGAFLPFWTDDGAARAGTFGTLRMANNKPEPMMPVPAGGDIRLRLLNIDNTRIAEIGVDGAEAAIVAIDGNPVSPIPLTSWRLGPAMRLDLVVRAPGAGREARIVDYFAPEPITVARLRGTGAAPKRGAFDPAPLYASDIPAPDLANAVPLRFDFSATALPDDVPLPNGDILRYADALCLSDKTFWAINGQAWPEDGHEALPAPLAKLDRGTTYAFELVNSTPHQHPIHMHGHTFMILGSNKRPLPRHHADTVLLAPKERVRVAFVADNPGDWMFHCHIIEHQDTGMMGIIRVA